MGRAKLMGTHNLSLHMVVIIVGSVLAGPAASKLFLDLGVTAIHFRYPLAALAGYAAYLGLIRLWLHSIGWNSARTRRMSWLEHLGDPSSGPGAGQVSNVPIFGGGHSGGGGASDQWSPGVRGRDAASRIGDLGEVVGWLVLLVACVGGIGIWFIYAAEDKLLGISGQAFNATFLNPDAWLVATVRSSGLEFACVFAVTIKLGLSIHHHFPDAIRLADVFAH